MRRQGRQCVAQKPWRQSERLLCEGQREGMRDGWGLEQMPWVGEGQVEDDGDRVGQR